MRSACRSLFGRRRSGGSSARTTVIADVIHRDIVDDGFVVNVCDVGDVVDRAVVVKGSVIPISTFVARSNVTVAIEDPSIETDLWPPVAGIPNIGRVLPGPVSRSPQQPDRSKYPSARHPIIVVITVGPVTGRPNVTIPRTNRLLVDGQSRWTDLDGDAHSDLRPRLDWNQQDENYS